MGTMPLTRKFFLWNLASILTSIVLSALAALMYIAVRSRWNGRGAGNGLPPQDAPGAGGAGSGMVSPGLSTLPDMSADMYLRAGLIGFVCLIIISITMTLWVTRRFMRGVIAPVTRLNEAAVKISEGDLSSGIAVEGEGEVRELCHSLETLRIKLKETIYMQERYDENRKFLLSSISHDLKTPVTSIKGYIEGIIDGVANTPEKMARYLETARLKTIQVNNMIDDLLLYSKLDLDQLPYHFEQVDMRAYFTDCIEDHRYAFDQRGVHLTLVDQLQEPVMIRIDVERFQRVMQNILNNALKHADKENGLVQLVMRETRTSVIIEVRDNGPGIPEEHLPHIFERFYRADASRSNVEGSGLGLAIAKQIVEAHEGRIWARSTVGEGTRIMISLRKYEAAQMNS
jgi:signal transduction histidine kinase